MGLFYQGRPLLKQSFRYWRTDEDGADDIFETDQAFTDTFTLVLAGDPIDLASGRFLTVTYSLTPTNAVTYQLFLAGWANADNVLQASQTIYASAAGKASGTFYQYEIDVVIDLITPGVIYYAIDWSGAPGNTSGFIWVSGETYQ